MAEGEGGEGGTLLEQGGEGGAGAGGEGGDKGGNGAGKWAWSDDIVGEGDRPDWLVNDHPSVQVQAEAYVALQKQFGGFTGAPKDGYMLSLPEGIKGDFDKEAPLLTDFQSIAKESNMSQDTFTKMLHAWVSAERGAVMERVAGEVEALGDEGRTRIKDVSDFLKANLAAGVYSELNDVLSSAAGIRAFEAVIKLVAPGQTGGDEGAGGEALPTEAELDEMFHAMTDETPPRRKYEIDKDYKAHIDELFKKVHGSGEDVQLVSLTGQPA